MTNNYDENGNDTTSDSIYEKGNEKNYKNVVFYGGKDNKFTKIIEFYNEDQPKKWSKREIYFNDNMKATRFVVYDQSGKVIYNGDGK